MVIDVVPSPVEDTEVHNTDSPPWNGFVLVGDNIDLNVLPRHKRVDNHTQSFHFFHSYAVRDRIKLHNASDIAPPHLVTPVKQLPLKDLLPSVSDHQFLIHNFSILVSRVLVSELDYFRKTFGDVVINHISHEHSSEMQLQSEVVSANFITTLITCICNVGTIRCYNKE